MKKYHHHFPYIAWAVALLATLGSLYFSEVLKFTPCVLCWYQRIAVYPLVVILLVGIIRKDEAMAFYALPLAGIGFLVSLYQNLLYYHVLPEAAAPCGIGASCTTQYVNYFGFISIPLLSLAALAVIIVCLSLYAYYVRRYRHEHE